MYTQRFFFYGFLLLSLFSFIQIKGENNEYSNFEDDKQITQEDFKEHSLANEFYQGAVSSLKSAVSPKAAAVYGTIALAYAFGAPIAVPLSAIVLMRSIAMVSYAKEAASIIKSDLPERVRNAKLARLAGEVVGGYIAGKAVGRFVEKSVAQGLEKLLTPKTNKVLRLDIPGSSKLQISGLLKPDGKHLFVMHPKGNARAPLKTWTFKIGEGFTSVPLSKAPGNNVLRGPSYQVTPQTTESFKATVPDSILPLSASSHKQKLAVLRTESQMPNEYKASFEISKNFQEKQYFKKDDKNSGKTEIDEKKRVVFPINSKNSQEIEEILKSIPEGAKLYGIGDKEDVRQLLERLQEKIEPHHSKLLQEYLQPKALKSDPNNPAAKILKNCWINDMGAEGNVRGSLKEFDADHELSSRSGFVKQSANELFPKTSKENSLKPGQKPRTDDYREIDLVYKYTDQNGESTDLFVEVKDRRNFPLMGTKKGDDLLRAFIDKKLIADILGAKFVFYAHKPINPEWLEFFEAVDIDIIYPGQPYIPSKVEAKFTNQVLQHQPITPETTAASTTHSNNIDKQDTTAQSDNKSESSSSTSKTIAAAALLAHNSQSKAQQQEVTTQQAPEIALEKDNRPDDPIFSNRAAQEPKQEITNKSEEQAKTIDKHEDKTNKAEDAIGQDKKTQQSKVMLELFGNPSTIYYSAELPYKVITDPVQLDTQILEVQFNLERDISPFVSEEVYQQLRARYTTAQESPIVLDAGQIRYTYDSGVVVGAEITLSGITLYVSAPLETIFGATLASAVPWLVFGAGVIYIGYYFFKSDATKSKSSNKIDLTVYPWLNTRRDSLFDFATYPQLRAHCENPIYILKRTDNSTCGNSISLSQERRDKILDNLCQIEPWVLKEPIITACNKRIRAPFWDYIRLRQRLSLNGKEQKLLYNWSIQPLPKLQIINNNYNTSQHTWDSKQECSSNKLLFTGHIPIRPSICPSGFSQLRADRLSAVHKSLTNTSPSELIAGMLRNKKEYANHIATIARYIKDIRNNENLLVKATYVVYNKLSENMQLKLSCTDNMPTFKSLKTIENIDNHLIERYQKLYQQALLAYSTQEKYLIRSEALQEYQNLMLTGINITRSALENYLNTTPDIFNAQERAAALKNTPVQTPSVTLHTFELSPTFHAYIKRFTKDGYLFTACAGTAIQQTLHKEVVTLLHDLYTYYQKAGGCKGIDSLSNIIVLLLRDAAWYNQEGNIFIASSVLDAAHAVYQYAQEVIQKSISSGTVKKAAQKLNALMVLMPDEVTSKRMDKLSCIERMVKSLSELRKKQESKKEKAKREKRLAFVGPTNTLKSINILAQRMSEEQKELGNNLASCKDIDDLVAMTGNKGPLLCLGSAVNSRISIK